MGFRSDGHHAGREDHANPVPCAGRRMIVAGQEPFCFLRRPCRGPDRPGGRCLNPSLCDSFMRQNMANRMRSKCTLPVGFQGR